MSNLLTEFSFENSTIVRTVEENGDIWFVARDVAKALQYSMTGSIQSMFEKVPEIWKGSKRIATPGGKQDVLCISEQGLYFFLGRSDKPKALPFQMWLAGEVLPAIRKTGSYSLLMKNFSGSSFFDDPDSVVLLAEKWRDERRARLALEAKNQELESHNQQLEAKIDADKDKVAFAEAVESCDDAILIRTFAKILYKKGFLTIGEQRLYRWLRNHKVLMSGGKNHNMPYQSYMDRGWFTIKEHVVMINNQEVVKTTTMITGKGQTGILKMLEDLYKDKVKNNLPLVF